MDKKILSVGGGLAGLCVAVQLYRRRVPFKILVSPHLPCSSVKAAGIMNPVVVKRLLKTWLADSVLPYNQQFYPELEKLVQASLYKPLPVYRIFNNENVRYEWELRIKDGSMGAYMSPEMYAYKPNIVRSQEWGGADVWQAASVDCEQFITATRRFFENKKLLTYAEVNYDAIQMNDSSYTLHGETYSDIVFCEGMNMTQNPWFKELPLVPTKGELLYVEIPDLPRDKELMKGVFLAPQQQGGFVCGSTYDWQFEHDDPTDAGREKLEAGLKEIIQTEYRVAKHTAGVRPASRDRRPYLGMHPEHKTMFVFNGLGTKGYMLAPYLSNCLVELVLDGKILDKEMNTERVKKK